MNDLAVRESNCGVFRWFKSWWRWAGVAVGALAVLHGSGGMREPKCSARAWYTFNEESFADVFDPRFAVLNHSEGPEREISYGEGNDFTVRHQELVLSQKTFERAFTSLGMDYSLRAYKAAAKVFQVRRADFLGDGRSGWYLEFRHDDPEHCVRFVNAVLKSYESNFGALLKTKGITGMPTNLFEVESFAVQARKTSPAAVWIFVGGLLITFYSVLMFGREILGMRKRQNVRRGYLSGVLVLLILSAGCATTEGEPLVRESDADRLITLRDKAVTAKVISSDTAGKKYIENYLLGSAPARTRVYGKVVFRIETVMKGQVEEPELKLEREVGLYEVMATTNSFLPMIGDGYLIGFDGRPGNPRKVIFVRSPQREASLDR